MKFAANLGSPRSMKGNVGNPLAMRPFIGKDGETYIIQMNAGKPVKVRVNASALLQYDEWKDIDRTVIEVAAQRLGAVNDLRERGLEHNLGSIGVTLSMWDRVSDMTEANVSMSAKSKGEKDTVAYESQGVPVPIIHKEFEIELRRLEASRRFGEALDVTQARIAARLVAEKTEQILFNGSTKKVDGNLIYGYLNHPDRSQVDMATAWTSATGAQIFGDVQAMVAAARTARHFGPWVLYIPAGYEGLLDNDYKAGTDSSDPRTVRDRIMGIKGIEDIKVADFLTGNNVVLVTLTADVVDLAVGQDITTVNWSVNGGMSEDFKVMAIWTPRVKSDFDGRSGVVHLWMIP